MKHRSLPPFVLLAALLVAFLGATAGAGMLGDVTFSSKATAEYGPAYFPHWVHRIKYKCYACHNELWAMKRGTHPTMDEMAAGKSCGACHNEKVAFGTDACQRCHIGG